MFDDLIESPRDVPDMSMYPDAFDEEYIPRFSVGDQIFFERWSITLPTRRWLSTQRYTVKRIEEDRLWLYNEDLQSWELTDFIRGIQKHGFKYKLTRKIKKAPTSPVFTHPIGEVKRRGRPKGSKNKNTRNNTP